MNSAAARAARRRGTSSRTSPLHHGSSSSAGATTVVLPAPGGAIRMRRLCSRSADKRSSNTAWIGKVMAARPARLAREAAIALHARDPRGEAVIPFGATVSLRHQMIGVALPVADGVEIAPVGDGYADSFARALHSK